ncbi:hypothetical protein [Streptomyces sp. NPDC020965]|uniref:hypothetical protein n=1 Tax=Streptomyces sp. NPDC020965 TaxID=3365105 RepID=UPI003790F7D3
MTRVDLAITGATAGVAPLGFAVPDAGPVLLGATLLAVVPALVAGTVTARSARRRHGDRGGRGAVVGGLLLLGVTVPCPLPAGAATTPLALALCAFAVALVIRGLPRPARSGFPDRRRPAADGTVLLLSAVAGGTAAVLWLSEARGAAGVLACTGALLQLARSIPSPHRSFS